jgi:S1-C subfamily serine protease
MAQQLNLGADNLPKGVGTGFVWDNLGHIVTNFHVINKVDTALVTVTNKKGESKQYIAKLTGVDPDKDIAVLKIDALASELRPIPLGTASTVKVGQYALAIGNPFGQDHTLTTGVISGKNREITAPTGRKIKGILQTDAAINPGNSGGPLLDSKGRLIGINTASLGAGVSAGVGFALPVDAVRGVVDQIIQFGAVQRAILGITYLERLPTPAEAERSGLPRIERGVVVLEVPSTSPALAAGLQGVQRSVDPAVKRTTVGDVIVGIDDKRIDSPPDLTAALEAYKPGDKISLKVLRGPAQEAKSLTVALGSFRGSTFTGLQSERAQVSPAGGATVPLNVPLGEIAPQITPRMPDGPMIP